jgi:hypothetical protein
VSFSQVPQTPPTGLKAEAARPQQRQLDDRAARAAQTDSLRPSTPDGLHRMVARVRTALRAHRGVDRSSR